MTDSVLAQAFIYLCAATIVVPIAKRLGLGAVLGYLLAGVIIGRYVLRLVGTEGEHVMHFAEFGVVMMLFLVGLELRPALLWQLRRPIVGLGGLQVAVTAAVLGAGALALGVALRPAIAIGLTFAMSSTAIVLSTLAERGLLKTRGGQASFAVLLFQDISVIPILAVFPLLGVVAATTVTDAAASGRPAWLSAVIVLGAVVGVVAIGRFVIRPVFQFLAAARLREAFTAAALAIVVGIALLMLQVGLSPALGTFLAGVVLADSEYRHELETDIEPFKGLLLGLFFISVGAQIDFGLIARQPLGIAGLVIGTMAVKLGVLHVLGRIFGLDRPARWLLAISLAQVGEFAFVLLSLGVQAGVFAPALASTLVATVAISMVLSPPATRRWSYAASKIYDEHLALRMAEEEGLKVTILRFFNAYGARNHPSWWGGPLSVFFEDLLDGREMELHGDGRQTRSFTYVSDTVDGVVRALERPETSGEVINVGNDQPIAIVDLAAKVQAAMGIDGPLRARIVSLESIGGNYQDVRHRVPDLSKAKRLLGFEPQVSLEEGLAKTLAWHQALRSEVVEVA